MRYLCVRAWRRFAIRWRLSLIVIIQLSLSLIVLSCFLNSTLSLQSMYEGLEHKLSKNTYKVVPVRNQVSIVNDTIISTSMPFTPLIYERVREHAKSDAEVTWYLIAPRTLVYNKGLESVYCMYVSPNYFDFFPNLQMKDKINADKTAIYLSSWLSEKLKSGAYFVENKQNESQKSAFSGNALLEHSTVFDAGSDTLLIEHNENLQKSVDMKNVILIPMDYFSVFYRYEAVDLSFISVKEVGNGNFMQGLQRLSVYLNEEANADFHYSIRSELDDIMHVTEMARLTSHGFIYISLLSLLLLILGYIGLQIQYFHSRMQEFAACFICGSKLYQLCIEIFVETLFKVIPALFVSVLCTHVIGGYIKPTMSLPYQVHWQTDVVSGVIVLGFALISTLPVILRLITTNLRHTLSEV
ncbi:FtsX-like permease family protein [Paenibacillus sp. HB172176]|uniref:FtsX-like permease family protein n=1 Tax=Paenibacillus sp. HB172176 TaxID=2493690 RepID=UPI00143C8C30|nr:FtsX-like permease family protein [Paenibacillus sp. HB172176]